MNETFESVDDLVVF